ncbi:MAG TPA: peptidoglycan-binding protein LysM, partial [Geomonas sp.]
QVRIVSENPGNRQRFYRSLLTAAQFYSFEEDFSVDFGTDPKITVHADFKIEKSPDSLLRQDVALLNVSENRRATPDGLVRLLAGNGFRVVEAGNPSYQGGSGAGDLLYQVTGKEPKKILDSFLDALSVPFETGKSIDLYAQEHIGVRLDVPVDRYFEDHGQRYVVALFNGDPVNYTLIRLLETKGYRVIMLQEGDDFHSIADKVLSRLHIPGRYGEHDLWPVRNVGYGVRMSGAMIRDNRNGDRNLFVTDRDLDPLVKELADLNGYRLLDGR